MRALLISSEDPDRDYAPENKWDLFKERIASQGSALWGINAPEPSPEKIQPPFWAYIVVVKKPAVEARMHVISYRKSPTYPERAPLPDDPRRIPTHRHEPWQLFLEIDAFELVHIPLVKEDLEKIDGGKVTTTPQGRYTIIKDPIEQ
ncbi:MAG: hypothetical protein AB1384_08170 [Actinomycetota bacterium]